MHRQSHNSYIHFNSILNLLFVQNSSTDIMAERTQVANRAPTRAQRRREQNEQRRQMRRLGTQYNPQFEVRDGFVIPPQVKSLSGRGFRQYVGGKRCLGLQFLPTERDRLLTGGGYIPLKVPEPEDYNNFWLSEYLVLAGLGLWVRSVVIGYEYGGLQLHDLGITSYSMVDMRRVRPHEIMQVVTITSEKTRIYLGDELLEPGSYSFGKNYDDFMIIDNF